MTGRPGSATLLAVLVIAAGITAPMAAGAPSGGPIHMPQQDGQTREPRLDTKVFLPEDHRPELALPLVLALHGFGASAADFEWAAPAFTRRDVIFVTAQAPYEFEREGRIGRDWFLSHTGDRAVVQATIPRTVAALRDTAAELRRRFAVSELYLLGFSQGGRLTYRAGPGSHELIDGLAIFGAGFDAQTMDRAAVAASAGSLRVFIGHGTEDRIELSNATSGRDFLREAGYDVTFQSFPAGHTLPPNMIVRVVDWILEGR